MYVHTRCFQFPPRAYSTFFSRVTSLSKPRFNTSQKTFRLSDQELSDWNASSRLACAESVGDESGTSFVASLSSSSGTVLPKPAVFRKYDVELFGRAWGTLKSDSIFC